MPQAVAQAAKVAVGFVGKRVALTSVPYSKINAVSFVSDKSMLGKLASHHSWGRRSG